MLSGVSNLLELGERLVGLNRGTVAGNTARLALIPLVESVLLPLTGVIGFGAVMLTRFGVHRFVPADGRGQAPAAVTGRTI